MGLCASLGVSWSQHPRRRRTADPPWGCGRAERVHRLLLPRGEPRRPGCGELAARNDPGSAHLHQAVAECVHDELDPIAAAGLGQQCLDMGLDGGLGQVQALADLGIGQSVAHQ